MKHGDLVLIAVVNELGLYLGERKSKWKRQDHFRFHQVLTVGDVKEFCIGVGNEKYVFEVIS